VIVVDTNVLVALADRRDTHHAECRDWLAGCDEPLIVPPTVLAEASYMIDKYLGAESEAKFLDSVGIGPSYRFQLAELVAADLRRKTLDPYLAGWRKRVVPALGHLPLRMITNGAVDRAVHGWIAEQCSRSTVKNSLAVLVRVMEQAVRDGVMDRNPARIIGWQRDYQRAEDELDDPRSLALPDWQALCDLAAALVARSADHFEGWGDVVIFAACTAARIGEVSGVRCADIDRNKWT